MAGINIRELHFRVTSRPDILPGDLRSALMEGGIAVCQQSNLLKNTVFTTLPLGGSKLLVPLPPNHDMNRVDEVYYRDPTDSTGDWMELGEMAPVFLENQRVHSESQNQGSPRFWGARGDYLFLQAPADGPYPLRIKYSYAPTRASQPEIFDLPAEAAEAIVAYARWILLQDKDPKLSDKAKKAFNDSLPDLRAMGETGESGTRHILDFLPFEG